MPAAGLCLTLLAGLSLAVWLYLLLLRDGFWRADQRLSEAGAEADPWPEVVAVVPARDEAAVIGTSLAGLLAQDYPGRFRVVLVDDHSGDGTAEAAQRAAAGNPSRLTVIAAGKLPPDWSGKLWALSEGLREAARLAPEARYLWLSDADIAHGPAVLRCLVAQAEGRGLDLVSVMAMLSCRRFWERLLIPPFIYFFQKLYPFPAANDPAKATAAAAGGCVLLRREALAAAGGLAAIRGALIDDCSLARLIKRNGGRTWLGLSHEARSLRPYSGLTEIWDMVARSAYTQLRHSPLLLAGTLAGMLTTYLVPPLAVVLAWPLGAPWAGLLGLAAWAIMSFTLLPTLRFYGQPLIFAPALPLAALLYSAMTLDSAMRHWRGRGGAWKGRTLAQSPRPR
jgi:hopene-associated glycosyltransferase HpnB